MQDAIRVLAGDCTVHFRQDDPAGIDEYERRGSVVVLVKPDNTVLVHDADGYQPAAWLTRADAVQYARDADGFTIDAADDGDRLRVDSEAEYGHAHYPATPAGPPVGDCPACGDALVRDGGRVVCTGCLAAHSIPRDATVLEDDCACGLPRMRVARGDEFAVCVDRECESIDDAVRERFGGAWPCPDCGDPLDVRRERGLRAVCDDCDRRLRVPVGVVAGTCDCGLPRFDAAAGRRCLDPECGADPPGS
jgi:DNA topoisomerase-1